MLGKAGRSRHLGIRPINRGVTRNPVDHPNGGGRGGQVQVRRRLAAAYLAVGIAGQGISHAQPEEAFEPVYFGAPRWPANEEQVSIYGTFHQEKSVYRRAFAGEGFAGEGNQVQGADQDLVAALDHLRRNFVGLTFNVHNGKIFNAVFVTENMAGHRLGEFSPTRTFRKHGAHTAKAEAK